jgi:hypothetical protein
MSLALTTTRSGISRSYAKSLPTLQPDCRTSVALNPTAFAHSGPLSSGWKDKSAADIALTSVQGNLPNTASGL